METKNLDFALIFCQVRSINRSTSTESTIKTGLCSLFVPRDTQILLLFTFEVGGWGGGARMRLGFFFLRRGIIKAAFLSVNNYKFDWSHHRLRERTDTDAVGAAVTAAVTVWL